MYRDRETIAAQKKKKGGNSAATWFLKDNTTTTVSVAATPGGILQKKVKEALRDIKGPDGGSTMVIEKGGRSILSGIEIPDPFKENKCRFNDIKCIVDNKQDCGTSSACYEITCDLCNTQVTHPDQQAPHRVKKSGWVASKRLAEGVKERGFQVPPNETQW